MRFTAERIELNHENSWDLLGTPKACEVRYSQSGELFVQAAYAVEDAYDGLETGLEDRIHEGSLVDEKILALEGVRDTLGIVAGFFSPSLDSAERLEA